jgi:hypothetical protein
MRRPSEVNAMSRPSPTSLRVWASQMGIVAVLGCAIAPPASAVDRLSIPRVRDTGDATIAAMLREAAERSPTFRRIVALIDATDGIVYIEEGTCGHSVRACLPISMKAAGPHRLLRIVVDLRRARDELMAAIGHELRHALEVLMCPSIRTSAAMYFFYDQGNPTKNDSFETRAAVEAGLDIAAELKHSAARPTFMSSIQPESLSTVPVQE